MNITREVTCRLTSGDAIADIQQVDMTKGPDMLFVMGTSLKIVGVKRMIKDFSGRVKENGGLVIFMNLTPVSGKEWSDIFDYHLICPTDSAVSRLWSDVQDMEKSARIKSNRTKNARTAREIKTAKAKEGLVPITKYLKEVKNIPAVPKVSKDVNVTPKRATRSMIPVSSLKKKQMQVLIDSSDKKMASPSVAA